MKHIKLTLLFLIFLSMPLYANITPRFGIETDFTYINLKNSEFSPNGILSNETSFYAGFEYLTFNFYFSFTPAFKIYTINNFSVEFENGSFIKKNEEEAKITFFFNDIYLSYAGNNFGIYFGKGIFHFGEGFNRQYMFVGDSVLNNDYSALYNAQINIYQGNITHSIGFIPDTVSIDKLEKPEYYLGWYSISYSTASLGLLGIAEYDYDVVEKKNNFKLGFETSYIFNKGIKIYGNIVYDLINENSIGSSTSDIKSLIGINYTWLYDDNIIMPVIEYFYEDSHSFYSIALHASFFDGMLALTTSFVHSPSYKMDFIAMATLNIDDQFAMSFKYNTPLGTSNQLINIFELSLEYNY